MAGKTCTVCGEHKDLCDFYLRSDSGRFRPSCKVCFSKESCARSTAKTKTRKGDELIAFRTRTKRADRKHRATIEYRAKNNANNARYRARKLNATPKWLTPDQLRHIELYYELAALLTREWGQQFEVDHIIPLAGKDVCGLHVPWNLQVMVKEANCSKGNRYDK